MQLDAKRRDWLKSNGYNDSEIQQIETNLATKALEGEGRESKEKSETVTPEPAQTPVTPVAAAQTEEPAPEPVAEKAATPVEAGQPFNVKELIDAVTAVVKPVVERVDQLEKAVGALATIQAKTEDTLAQKAKSALDETPAWSLKELMSMSVFGPESRVNGNSALAKDAPKEKEATIPDGVLPLTGIAFVDELIAKSRATPVA